MSGIGQAAGALNPVPRVVKTGRSFPGVQVGAVSAGFIPVGNADPFVPFAVVESTSSNWTICVLPSLKESVIDPEYTPAARFVMDGVTVMETVWAGLMALALGAKLNHFGVIEPAPENVIGADVKFEIVKVCGLIDAPGGPRNRSPLGETTGGAAVPAGTICKTIAIETGGCFPSVGLSVTAP
jgi:hypothetical protein